jgi:septum site-determining protein MinC
MDSDKVKEAIYKKAVEDVTKVTNKDSVEVETSYDSDDNANAQFYTGTLRSGQQVSCEGSVVIIGDVNPGATVTSGGNIVILGSLRGTAIAGCNGDTSTFVVALEMDPLQIRIGDVIASSNDNSFMSTMNIREKRKAQQVKIAYADNDNIYIDLLNKETINNIIN